MKKYILQILLFLMFIPFVVNAETCDTDKITIDNINKTKFKEDPHISFKKVFII
jgi:hypothetical protein